MLEELKKFHKLEKEHLQVLFDVMVFYEIEENEYSMYTVDILEKMTHYLICALDLCEYGILDAYIVEDEYESKFMFEVNELFKSPDLFNQVYEEMYEEMCEFKEEKISVTSLH